MTDLLRRPPSTSVPDGYKWTALFISTLGMLMATIDGSIVLIAMPDIFRGIGIDPLEPGNSFYLLWMILGFLVVDQRAGGHASDDWVTSTGGSASTTWASPSSPSSPCCSP